MQAVYNGIVDSIKQNFYQFVSQTHAFVINHGCQTLFFMLAIYRIIMAALKRLNLFFAEYNWTEIILKTIIFVLFLYVKVWDKFPIYMQIIGYFCATTISIYLYSGCIRLGSCLYSYNKGFYANLSIAMSTILIFLSYQIYNLSQFEGQSQPKYQFVAIYFLLLVGFVSLGILRNQLIYSMIILITLGLIIILRQYVIVLLHETFLSKCNLPLQAFFYVLFAVQQNYLQKQQQRKIQLLNGQIQQNQVNHRAENISQFFIAQIYFYGFFLINKRMFPTELIFGIVCISNFIWRRRTTG